MEPARGSIERVVVPNFDAGNASAKVGQDASVDELRRENESARAVDEAGLRVFPDLRDAGLVNVRRDGRSMIYAAQFETMNTLLGFLTENCCQGAAEKCAPAVCRPAKSKRAKVTV